MNAEDKTEHAPQRGGGTSSMDKVKHTLLWVGLLGLLLWFGSEIYADARTVAEIGPVIRRTLQTWFASPFSCSASAGWFCFLLGLLGK